MVNKSNLLYHPVNRSEGYVQFFADPPLTVALFDKLGDMPGQFQPLLPFGLIQVVAFGAIA